MQNNFNDTVNELKDFNLNPSEQVWKEIESNLDEKKKRRIVAWWWIFPLIGLFGAGFFMYNRTKTVVSKNNTSINAHTTSSVGANNENIKGKINAAPIKNKSADVQIGLLGLQSRIASTQTRLSRVQPDLSDTQTQLLRSQTDLSYTQTGLSRSQRRLSSTQTALQRLQTGLTLTSNDSARMQIGLSHTANNFASVQTDFASEIVKSETPQNKNVDTAKHIDSNLIKKNTIAKAISKSKKTVWSLAIGGGVNYVSRNSILGESNQPVFYSSGLTSTPSTATASNPTLNLLGLPKTGYHFSLGVNVEKQLNKNLSLESGLMYRYLENKITFSNNSVTNFLSTNTSEYKNNLHLLELPVGLKYCFNSGSKNKISLLAAGNIAFAFKKNWLFVNDDLHLYQENSNEINTVLFGLQTGASIDFNNKFSLSLVARKYLTPVQKSSSKYYLQQLDFQLNIPFKSFKK